MFIDSNENLRVCDIFFFTMVFRDMVTSSNNIKMDYPNVYRWFNYLQSLDGIH